MSSEKTEKIAKAISAAGVLLRDQIDAATLRALAEALSEIPPDDVTYALRRIAAIGERITLATVLAHLPGAHPPADIAWALVTRDRERAPALAVDAWRQASHLRDETAQRYAFLAAYRNAVADARARGDYYARTAEARPRNRIRALPMRESAEAISEIRGALRGLLARLRARA